MQKIEGTSVHVIIPQEMLARIDRVAKRLKLTRSETMRNTLDVGLSTFETLEKGGIIRFAEIMQRTEKALRTEIGQQSLFKA